MLMPVLGLMLVMMIMWIYHPTLVVLTWLGFDVTDPMYCVITIMIGHRESEIFL